MGKLEDEPNYLEARSKVLNTVLRAFEEDRIPQRVLRKIEKIQPQIQWHVLMLVGPLYDAFESTFGV